MKLHDKIKDIKRNLYRDTLKVVQRRIRTDKEFEVTKESVKDIYRLVEGRSGIYCPDLESEIVLEVYREVIT